MKCVIVLVLFLCTTFCIINVETSRTNFPRNSSYLINTPVNIKRFLDGQTNFNVAVLKQITLNSGNFFFSPLALKTNLAFIADSTTTKSRTEILRKLKVFMTDTHNRKLFNEISRLIRNMKNNYVASKMYIDNELRLDEKFIRKAMSYNCLIEQVDFNKKIETIKQINKWVEQKTYGKIKNIIYDDGDIDPDTSLLLVNGIYHRGLWREKFQVAETTIQNFYNWGKIEIHIPTMSLKSTFNYYNHKKLKATFLEIPYEGINTSMVIVLPNKKNRTTRN